MSDFDFFKLTGELERLRRQATMPFSIARYTIPANERTRNFRITRDRCNSIVRTDMPSSDAICRFAFPSANAQRSRPLRASEMRHCCAARQQVRVHRRIHMSNIHFIFTHKQHCGTSQSLLNRKASGFPISSRNVELSGCYGLVLTFVSSLSFLGRSCGQTRVY